jgi:hypothetical protein
MLRLLNQKHFHSENAPDGRLSGKKNMINKKRFIFQKKNVS